MKGLTLKDENLSIFLRTIVCIKGDENGYVKSEECTIHIKKVLGEGFTKKSIGGSYRRLVNLKLLQRRIDKRGREGRIVRTSFRVTKQGRRYIGLEEYAPEKQQEGAREDVAPILHNHSNENSRSAVRQLVLTSDIIQLLEMQQMVSDLTEKLGGREMVEEAIARLRTLLTK